jgi:hypothetical protein
MNNLGLGTTHKLTGYRAGFWSNTFSLGYDNSPTTNQSNRVLPVKTKYLVTVGRINNRYYFLIDGVLNPPLCLVGGHTYQFNFQINPEVKGILKFSDTRGLNSTYSIDGNIIKEQNLWDTIRNGSELTDIKISVKISDNPTITRASYFSQGQRIQGNWIKIRNQDEAC